MISEYDHDQMELRAALPVLHSRAAVGSVVIDSTAVNDGSRPVHDGRRREPDLAHPSQAAVDRSVEDEDVAPVTGPAGAAVTSFWTVFPGRGSGHRRFLVCEGSLDGRGSMEIAMPGAAHLQRDLRLSESRTPPPTRPAARSNSI